MARPLVPPGAVGLKFWRPGESVQRIADAWNVGDTDVGIALSNNDKTATSTITANIGTRSTTARTNNIAGKYYAEWTVIVGLASNYGIKSTTSVRGTQSSESNRLVNSGSIYLNATLIGSLGALADGDVVCVAWDSFANKIWFRKNNSFWNNDAAADPATGTNGLTAQTISRDYCLYWSGLTGAETTLRTESAEFAYVGPSGFTSWMGEPLPSTVTVETVGTADGVGAASAVGESNNVVAGDGAAAGVGAASATGSSITILESVGDADGVGAASAAGTGIKSADASTASGLGTASATGFATATGAGTAAGVGAAAAAGIGLAAGVGTAAGIGAATAIGTGIKSADASTASGLGTASATAAATAASVGDADGIGAASATGALIGAGGGDADGIGQATATGRATGASAGDADGIGTAVGIATATAASVGTAQGDGAALALSDPGTTTGEATGQGTAVATGRAITVAVSAASGVGAASATGARIAAGVGTASGIGTAAAVSAEEAGVIVEAVGTASGIGTAHAVGRRIRERPSGGLGLLFRPGPAVIEGVGYGILPELEGYAVGTAGRRKTIAGRAKGVVALTGHGVCDIGVKGAAYSIARLPMMASATMDAGSAGQAQVSLSICKGAAMGDHDPDEHLIIALMLAA